MKWSSLNTDPDRHLTYDEYMAKYGLDNQKEEHDGKSSKITRKVEW